MEDGKKGISFCDALGLIFITLRLMGYIKWSWIWVLAPIWGKLALVVTVAVIEAQAEKLKKRR